MLIHIGLTANHLVNQQLIDIFANYS